LTALRLQALMNAGTADRADFLGRGVHRLGRSPIGTEPGERPALEAGVASMCHAGSVGGEDDRPVVEIWLEAGLTFDSIAARLDDLWYRPAKKSRGPDFLPVDPVAEILLYVAGLISRRRPKSSHVRWQSGLAGGCVGGRAARRFASSTVPTSSPWRSLKSRTMRAGNSAA
jgi:hypothetical protein